MSDTIQTYFNLNEFFDEDEKKVVVDFIKKKSMIIAKSGILYGTLEDDNFKSEYRTPNLIDISHIIERINIVSSNVIIDLKVLSTQKGKMISNFLEDNFHINIIPIVIYNPHGLIIDIRFDARFGEERSFRNEQIRTILGK